MLTRSFLFASLVAAANLVAEAHDEAITFISENLLVEQPIVVERQADDHLHARLLTWGETLGRYLPGATAQDQEIALAEQLAPLVREFQDPALNRAVRYHVRRMIRHHGELEPFIALRREVVASRLGITAEQLLAHPQLEALVVNNHLDVRFFTHNRTITFDNAGRPLLPYNGRPMALPTLLSLVPVDESGRMVGHLFNYLGIVEGSASATITPFRQEARGQTCIEIASTDCGTMPHVWLRLRTTDGSVYSIGQVRGVTLSPDPVEYMADPADILVTPLSVTREQCAHLLAFAGQLQRSGRSVDNLFDCCAFVKELLAQIALDDWEEISAVSNLYELREWQRQKLLA